MHKLHLLFSLEKVSNHLLLASEPNAPRGFVFEGEKMMHTANGFTQNYPFCKLQLVVETFAHST